MIHIDISLPNKIVEDSIDTPTYLLVYQDRGDFRVKGNLDIVALAPLLSKVNVETLLPLIMGLVKKKK